MGKKYISVKEVADQYGFPASTLYKWVAERKIPNYRVNGVIKFSPEKLDNWLAKKEVKPKATS